MDIKEYTSYHLIKSQELNHHGTLFAGRMTEWLVEAGFVAAATLTSPENIVCLKIHGLTFRAPVKLGEIVTLTSKIVHSGRTSLIAHVQANVQDKLVVSGFLTFIHVDHDGKPMPHGVEIVPTRPEDIELQKIAAALPN